uniref:Integrase n=1 Tax=Xanthomonas citri pv. punicae TaxID=487838 RepID=A0A088FSD7_XANCI|nr:integrase [Xanthomonas citri pv. punicae]
MTPPTPKLLDQVRGRLRLRHYSLRTEQVYLDWIPRFILANGQWPTASRTDGASRGRGVSHRIGGAGPGVGRHAGGRALADDAGGELSAGGGAAVCQRDAVAGMPALAEQGDGHSSRRNCSARWLGASICGMWSAGRAQPS